MKPTTLRHLIIALLLTTGIFHLATALLGTGTGVALPLTIFGFLYLGLSFYVRADTKDGSKSGSRNAILAAMITCAIGLFLGGSNYLQNGGPAALPIMFAIDIAIIAVGVLWLINVKKKA